MSDFMELSLRRQSCRNFADQPVEHDKLVQCVEMARLAPSACNSQPWSFVVVERPDIVAALAKSTMQLGLNTNMHTAKAFIVVLEEYAHLAASLRCVLDNQYFAAGDVGAVTLSLCLAAESLGLGSCILGVFDRESIREHLDIPRDRRIRMMVALGYQQDPAVRPKRRKPLAEIVRFV